MYFFIAAIVVVVACSAITIKTLVGYNDFSLLTKIIISALVLLGWTAPLLVGWIRKNNYLDGLLFNIVSYTGYFLFGLMFILFIMLILRDFAWYLVYGLAKLFDSAGWGLNPKNLSSLGYANLVIVIVAVATSVYAVREGTKVPEIKKIEFTSQRLQKDLHIVQLSDLHINRTSSAAHLQQIVDKTNALNPDIIALTGDVVDDHIDHLDSYMDILSGLKANNGVYFSVGNHENYNGLPFILKKLRSMGFEVLLNNGKRIEEDKIFISGIPDMQTAMSSRYLAVNFEKATKGAAPQDYRILLSHSPEMAEYVTKIAFDLVLTGHTHGGQIFPFHLLVKKANKFLAGVYKVNDVNVYVSRGAGYWGPPMRLFAPSEITDIYIKAVSPRPARDKKFEKDETYQELLNAQNFGLGL